MEQTRTASLARFKHHDIAALIDLYESNFLRLMRLVPDLDVLESTVVSRVADALDLYLCVEERFKYTTTVSLTYRFTENDSVILEPNARVCVYHDVRAAELVSHCRRKRPRTVRPWIRGRMPELENRWEMNRFLYKWLKFCTHQGHIFLNCTSHPVTATNADRRAGRPWHTTPITRLRDL
jgi:uncharacterized protein YqiB (DUF1249 family)